MKRVLRWGVAALVVILIAAYGLVSFMIASGVTKSERKPQEDNPSNYGLTFEDVEFPSKRGNIILKGWHINGQGEGPTIVFVHGISGNRSADKAVQLAAMLSAKGYNSLLFDLRAHGDSGGDRISGGYFEREDVLGAFDYLVKRGVPRERIGLIGFSMGAGTAIMAASEEPYVRALVVDSPYAKVSELIAQEVDRKTVFPEWLVPIFIPGGKLLANWLYDINVDAMVPEKTVTRLDYPILVIHGEADTRIPVEHGKRVYHAAESGSTLWLVPATDHVDAFANYSDEYVDKVASYFLSRLSTQ